MASVAVATDGVTQGRPDRGGPPTLGSAAAGRLDRAGAAPKRNDSPAAISIPLRRSRDISLPARLGIDRQERRGNSSYPAPADQAPQKLEKLREWGDPSPAPKSGHEPRLSKNLNPHIGERQALREHGRARDVARCPRTPCAASACARTRRTRRPCGRCRRLGAGSCPCTSRTCRGSDVISAAYFLRSRSAESWIGVSGFLISCAMRRATSFHASWRCAEMSLVMSSNVSTRPPSASGLMRTLRFTEPPSRTRSTRCGGVSPAAAGWLSSSANSGATSIRRRPTRCAFSRPSSCAAERFAAVMRPLRSRPMHAGADAAEHGFDEAARAFSASSCAVTRSRRCVSSCAVMRLKAVAERVDFVALFAHRDARFQIAGRDAPRRADKPADRFGHARRAGETNPTGGEQHDQRGRKIRHARTGRAASSAASCAAR